jgi:hypothetical protein
LAPHPLRLGCVMGVGLPLQGLDPHSHLLLLIRLNRQKYSSSAEISGNIRDEEAG